jgi:hypothetical protein
LWHHDILKVPLKVIDELVDVFDGAELEDKIILMNLFRIIVLCEKGGHHLTALPQNENQAQHIFENNWQKIVDTNIVSYIPLQDESPELTKYHILTLKFLLNAF